MCARPDSPGDWRAEVGLGVHVLLPSASVGLGARVADPLSLALAYHTVAGLVHDFDLEGRLDLGDDVALELTLSESLFAVTELAGIDVHRADFGDGFSTSLAAAYRAWDGPALTLVTSAGFTVRWQGPTIPVAFLDVDVAWPDGDGDDAWFLRLRAIVPVAIEAWVVGFLPWLIVGRSWDL